MKITEKTLRRIIREELLRKHTQQLNEWAGNPLIKSPDKIADQVEAGDRDADEALETLVKRKRSGRYVDYNEDLGRGIKRIRQAITAAGGEGLPTGQNVSRVVKQAKKDAAKKASLAKLDDLGISPDVSKGSLSTSDQTDTQEHMLIIIGLKSGTPEKADRYAIKKLLGCSNSQNCPDGKFGRRSAALWNAIQGNPDYKIQNVSSPLGELNGWRKSGKWQEAWTGLGAIDDKGELKKIGDKARAAVKKSDDKNKSLGKNDPRNKKLSRKEAMGVIAKEVKPLANDLISLVGVVDNEIAGDWAKVKGSARTYLHAGGADGAFGQRIEKAGRDLLNAYQDFASGPTATTLTALQSAVENVSDLNSVAKYAQSVTNYTKAGGSAPASPEVNQYLKKTLRPNLDTLRRALADYRSPRGNA